MPESPNPGQSYEAWIESKAGACPPDDLDVLGGYTAELPAWPLPPFRGRKRRDWPGGMPKPPPETWEDEAQGG